jgi:hypothetical protein
VALGDGTPVVLRFDTDYPVGDTVTLTVDTPNPRPFTLALRIPGWSRATEVSVCGARQPSVEPGQYLEVTRLWQTGDQVTLRFDMSLRYEPGDLQQFGRASLYRGPILLALDERFVRATPPVAKPAGDQPAESAEKAEPPAEKPKLSEAPVIDVAKLGDAKRVPVDEEVAQAAGDYPPWLVVDVPAGDETLRLVDFASAGASGGEYVSWLPAKGMRPPRPAAWQPSDRAFIGPGPIRFSWRPPASEAAGSRRHSVMVSESSGFERVVFTCGDQLGSSLLLPADKAAELSEHRPYYWKVVARNEFGESESLWPPKYFVIAPAAPPMPTSRYGEREQDAMLTAAPLNGRVEPEYGTLLGASGWKPAPGPDGQPDTAIELDGKGLVKYKLEAFPEEAYTVSIWTAPVELPEEGFGQVFSAWCGGMDDPLRLAVDKGKLFARIEAGAGYGTEGVALEPGRWYHVVGVKQQDRLTLYVDGEPRASAEAPLLIWSGARDFAVGGNPNYTGAPEFLKARFADLRVYAKALSAEEVRQLHDAGCGKR